MSANKIINWALPYVKRKKGYIDIGANNGDTVIPFLNEFETIIAFEPNPNTYKDIPTTVEKYNVALADFKGTTKLVIPHNTKNPEHGSIATRRMKNWQGETYEVSVNTLDSFNFTNIDFIKIDVEQGELEVIKGAMNTIKNNKPTIMFENKRNENDSVIEILRALEYTIIKHKSDTVAYFAK